MVSIRWYLGFLKGSGGVLVQAIILHTFGVQACIIVVRLAQQGDKFSVLGLYSSRPLGSEMVSKRIHHPFRWSSSSTSLPPMPWRLTGRFTFPEGPSTHISDTEAPKYP